MAYIDSFSPFEIEKQKNYLFSFKQMIAKSSSIAIESTSGQAALFLQYFSPATTLLPVAGWNAYPETSVNKLTFDQSAKMLRDSDHHLMFLALQDSPRDLH